jgi:drug/metabolite transporter (DMT)-like permease
MNDKSTGPGGAVTGRADRLTLVAFALWVLIGGGNGVAIRFSNFELPPFWGAILRLAAAAIIFWAILIARRVALPKGRALAGTLLYGGLGLGAANALFYLGLTQVPASVGGTVLAGGAIALAGMALALGIGFDNSLPVLPLLALAAGVACVAEASVVFKLFPKPSPVATNAIATTAGAAILVPVSLLAGESWFLPTTTATWAAFAYVVMAGSVALFYLYLFVLTRWTASATSYAFLLIPIAGIGLAAWIAREPVTPLFLAGSAIVLLGVWIGAIRQPAPAAAREESIAARSAATETAPAALEAQPCENC